MSKTSVADFDVVVANNTDVNAVGIQGSDTISSGDNALRSYAALLARFYDSLGAVNTVGGTASAITVTITEDWTAYATGMVLAIKAASASTGATTLNVTPSVQSALGAKAIRRQGDSALQANDMVASGVYVLRYDAAYNTAAGAWVLLNPAGSGVSFPITETQGGTNQTTYTQGDLLYASAANTLSKLAKGTAGQILSQTSTIPAWGGAITLGTATATTSGTSIDITGIPSGVKSVGVLFKGVSSSGTSNFLLQIGDSGGIESSSYNSGASRSDTGAVTTSTAGYAINASVTATMTFSGLIILSLESSSNQTWIEAGMIVNTANGATMVSGGDHNLSPGPLDRIRLTTVGGTDTFDAGEIALYYEF